MVLVLVLLLLLRTGLAIHTGYFAGISYSISGFPPQTERGARGPVRGSRCGGGAGMRGPWGGRGTLTANRMWLALDERSLRQDDAMGIASAILGVFSNLESPP